MRFIKFSIVIIVIHSLLVSIHAFAQQLSERRVQMMLDCTMRAHYGPWVEKNLYKDGQLRFNYLVRGVVKGQTDVILAYWNQKQSRGKALRFILYKNQGRNQLALVNDGWIEPFPGESDLYARDAWGGVYQLKIFMSALKKLRNRPVQTVLVKEIYRTSAVCRTDGWEPVTP